MKADILNRLHFFSMPQVQMHPRQNDQPRFATVDHSLDGYFEGPSPWSLDFNIVVWGEELEACSLEQLNFVLNIIA